MWVCTGTIVTSYVGCMMAEQRIDSWAAQFLTGSLKSLIIAFPGGGRALGHVPVVEMCVRVGFEPISIV